MSDTPKVGEVAPDFELKTADGSFIRLSDFRGRKNVVMYFYPKDFTPGCTKEACSFRDSYTLFEQVDTEVLGISTDEADSHGRFATELRLPFPLLIDEEKKVSEAYGARRLFGRFTRRVTFVINKDGVVRHVYGSEMRPNNHVREALDAVREPNTLEQRR
ncbi:MAG: peroxiredoxin [Candidatus Geothermarchaeales archaeon]